MTVFQMLSNLLISVAILCLGFWLTGFESVFAKIGGWILFLFGSFTVLGALAWFIGSWRGHQIQQRNPDLAPAIDRTIQREGLSQEEVDTDGKQIPPPQSSGATWEQAREEFKAEVKRLIELHPEMLVGETFDIAVETIKKRHPQFDNKNR